MFSVLVPSSTNTLMSTRFIQQRDSDSLLALNLQAVSHHSVLQVFEVLVIGVT